MTIARHHTEWLSLIEISGPFVSLPVLSKVFPQGLDERDAEKARNLRSTFEAYQEAPNNLATQLAWVKFVLSDTLSFYPEHLKEGQEIPPGLKAELLEHRETLRPDIAVVVPRTSESGEKVQQTQLLVSVYLKDQDLDAPIKGTHWKASPATRMAELLHASDVPLGLVTNGERWMLVYAPRGETTGFTSWYASLWFEEPKTLRAFHSLLSLQRVVGSADTLLSMLRESASDQQEVTDKLGRQVRDAVDVLVSAFSRLNIDSQNKLLEGISEKELYNAALTVMMRLVFLFCAEERGMLHLGKPLYDNNYAVSTLREQLQEDADQHGEEVLERRSDAWVRLLATFRAVYGGITHENLSLPAYGGTLFDPDRYCFLEGRSKNTSWRLAVSLPPEINNRVVLHLLTALQIIQHRVFSGSVEAQKVSFRALDTEQIGYIYEGLLDHTAFKSEKLILALETSKNNSVMMSFDILESHQRNGTLREFLQEIGISKSALNRLDQNVDDSLRHRMQIACGNQKYIYERILPYANILSRDSFGNPRIVFPEEVYVSEGLDRRNSGTHYTPRGLTDKVVKDTLTPLVYYGPSEGLPKDLWKIKTPEEIINLKICDMAMGSGAFLTAACRFLGEILNQSWGILMEEAPTDLRVLPLGKFSSSAIGEYLIPEDSQERALLAKRIIADNCLYGVDLNPLAVEMAKLSMWLTTMQFNKPFSFLDHKLKQGDSLIGIYESDQIVNFSLRESAKDPLFVSSELESIIYEIKQLRLKIDSYGTDTSTQIEIKQQLNISLEKELDKIRYVGDIISGLDFQTISDNEYHKNRATFSIAVLDLLRNENFDNLSRISHKYLGELRPFHWYLEFVDVFYSGGFDAFIGNPPFISGKGGINSISAVLGEKYADFLENTNTKGQRTADLCSYFFRRAAKMLKYGGTYGLIATNTISEGASRRVGLSVIDEENLSIYSAVDGIKWPGAAAVIVSIINVFKGEWKGVKLLQEKVVEHISTLLESNKDSKNPNQLQQHVICHHGTKPRGDFTVSFNEGKELEASPYLRKYLSGADVNGDPLQKPSRYIIYFPFDTEEECILAAPKLYQILRDKVYDYRVSTGINKLIVKWWKYENLSDDLYNDLQKYPASLVMACCRVSNDFMLGLVNSDYIFSDGTIVFIMKDWFEFGILQSSLFYAWARKYCSTFKNDMRMNTKDILDNFPLPELKDDIVEQLNEMSKLFYEERQIVMSKRGWGLTKLYNAFNTDNQDDVEISNLRTLRTNLDNLVLKMYGWEDITPHYDYIEFPYGTKYFIDEISRSVVLNRLLSLNHKYSEFQSPIQKNKGVNSDKNSPKKKKAKPTSIDKFQPKLL